MRIRCLTLNLKGLMEWFDDRDQLVIEGLSKLHPDVVFLQEAMVKKGTSFFHQAEFLAKKCQYLSYAYCPNGNIFDHQGDTITGLAVLSRWPIIESHVHALTPGSAKDARSAIFLSLQTDTDKIHVVNSHFSWQPELTLVRLEQMNEIINSLKGLGWLHQDQPLIMAGDFNAEDDEPAIKKAKTLFFDTFRHLNPQLPGYTWLGANPRVSGVDQHLPDRRVDYIFSSKTSQPNHCQLVFHEDLSKAASDHFGVLAEIDW